MISTHVNITKMLMSAFPFVRTLQSYRMELFKSDLVAGATVAAVLIPQAMAYALLAGLPPIHGLYAALLGSVVGALWGSSTKLATGPVAIVSFLSATALLPFASLGSEEFIRLSIILALMVGIFQWVLGTFRLGFVMRFVPQSVITGFTTAAAIIIAFTQLPSLLGIQLPTHEYVVQSVIALITSFTKLHPITTCIGIASVTLLMLMKRISSKLPSAIILVMIAIIASALLELERHGIRVVGYIPPNPPSFHIPAVSVSSVFSLVTKAALIALVGFVQTFAVTQLFENERNKQDVNQELIGQGLANTASSLFGGYSLSGSLSLTAIKNQAGASTSLAGVFTSFFILIALLTLTPLLSLLPKVILSAIVFSAMLPLINLQQLQYVYSLSRSDGAIALVTFTLSFLLKPDTAIVIGVIIALALFLNRVMISPLVEVGIDPTTKTLKAIRNGTHIQTFARVLMIRVDMSLMYMNSERVFSKLESMIQQRLGNRGGNEYSNYSASLP